MVKKEAETPLLRKDRDGVAILTLNRPERLNAVTASLLQCLHDELTAVSADEEIGAVVVTGAGRAFSAGQDLNERLCFRILHFCLGQMCHATLLLAWSFGEFLAENVRE